jgi:hypothetical protein
MTALLIRNTFALVKAETSYGTLASPIDNTDAVKIVSLEINPLTGPRVERNLIKGYLGADRQPLTNEHVAVTITFEWGGSGVAATAPRFTPLLQAAGMNLTSFAEITGTATAGGANTLTLANIAAPGPPEVFNPPTDAYLFYPIEITSGLNSGDKGVIVAHNGSTREVTVVPSTASFTGGAVNYKIPALSLLQPISTFGNGSSCTIVAVKDGTNVHRIEGFRGSPALNSALNGYGTFTITGFGRYTTLPASRQNHRSTQPERHADNRKPACRDKGLLHRCSRQQRRQRWPVRCAAGHGSHPELNLRLRKGCDQWRSVVH